MGPEKDDEFRGVGGSYTVGRDGRRKRVEQTTDHPEGNRPRDHKGEALVDKPADGVEPGLAPAGETKPWQHVAEEPIAQPAAPSSGSTRAASSAHSASDTADNVKKGG